MSLRLPAFALIALAFSADPGAARAAESYDNCAGFIDSLPAVVTKQGVWCMRKDLATASASGAAITVTAANVTIDCNGYKLGGLAAGVGTLTRGIQGSGTSNLTVRRCNVRGFYVGILIDNTSGGGNIVEDNRLDGNTLYGIRLWGDGSVVRRNLVIDTVGGTAGGNVNAGIGVTGEFDIIDNTVRGVSSAADRFSVGIFQEYGATGVISGNRISNLVASPTNLEYGIYAGGSQIMVRDNFITTATASGIAIGCGSATDSIYENMVTGPGLLSSGCYNAGGNSRP